MADGQIKVTIGSSRSGKTTFVIDEIKKSKRVIVWDVKAEFAALPGFKKFQDIRALHQWIKANPGKPGKLAFQSITLEHFDTWAKLAFAWAQFAPVEIICDELSDVTNAGKACGWWGVVIRRVLCTGSNVYAVSQRPTTSETDSMGNASIIHTGRLTRAADRKLISEMMDITRAEIDVLKQFEYIERDMNNLEIRKGKTRKPRK